VFYLVLFSFKIQTVLEERIYRSPQISANLLEKAIKEKGIKTILNLRGEDKESKWYIEESEICKKNNLTLYDCRLNASDLPKYRVLKKILDILLLSERPLLIHCAAGVDRTGFVSALALAIEKDLPLVDLKKQFSLRYGTLPFKETVGPRFFSNYEQWLDATQKIHSKANLIYWINQEYVDDQGNIEFYMDHINGKGLKERFTLPKDSKTITIEGWAFNTRTNFPLEDFQVVIDNQISIKAEKVNRTDVAKFFELKEHDNSFMVGWKVALDQNMIGSGSHKISFRIYDKNSRSLVIPTDYVFCIED
jgi:protein tyrosine phosphatase (PTP) superfamily phosphohydrolase (DUF442 family)